MARTFATNAKTTSLCDSSDMTWSLEGKRKSEGRQTKNIMAKNNGKGEGGGRLEVVG